MIDVFDVTGWGACATGAHLVLFVLFVDGSIFVSKIC